MPLIERVQKRVLFEEAARQSIKFGNFLQASEIYAGLIGTTDVGERRFGSPMAPVYHAKSGELVEVPRISKYFKGIARDLKVADVALTELEAQILNLNLETWARMELVKNRAVAAQRTALAERARVTLGGLWAFTETFTSVAMLDMNRTDAWVDASEGVALLPNGGPEQTVRPIEILVTSQTLPTGATTVGSDASQAIDGLEGTSWRVLFLNDGGQATAIYRLTEQRDVTAVQIDPIGFGLDLVVEVDNGTGYREVVRAYVYQKRTFPVEVLDAQSIRVSYKPASTAFPKIVGLREIILYSAKPTRSASVYSKLLRPDVPFTDVRVELKGQTPGGARLIPFVATASGGPWTELNPGAWKALQGVDAITAIFQVAEATPSQTFRGLYGYSQTISSYPAASDKEGELEVGLSQMEVTCFPRDFADIGEVPRILDQLDFDFPTARKTWADVPFRKFLDGQYYVRSFGGSELADQGLIRGDNIVFWRNPTRTDAPYHELCFVPLGGDKTQNMMQFGHNYRFRWNVFCKTEFEFPTAKYWFIQGYRKNGARPYREVGKSYGAFSMYVNNELVAGEGDPYTLFENNTLETGASTGRSFVFRLKKGWNLVEVNVSLVDPNSDPDTFLNDPLDAGDPLLQLAITPSFFDPVFQVEKGITQILASGARRPVSEFDLLWNLARDPTYWAWSSDRRAVLFNEDEPSQIDGFFIGVSPTCRLRYRSTVETVDDLYVRVDMERDILSRTGPTLEEYRVMVK